MSRIGKEHVVIPAGVTVSFADGVVTVKGAKGTLTQQIEGNILIQVEGNVANVVKGADLAELDAKRFSPTWLRVFPKASPRP